MRRHHLAVQQRYCEHVGQAVIGFFFCAHNRFVSFFTATDDLVRDIKDLHLDTHDLAGIDSHFRR